MNEDLNSTASNWEKTYYSLLERLRTSLNSAEKKTLEALHYDLEQAIELEAAAEEMTREEVSLLAAYLQRDLQDLSAYIRETRKGVGEWLKFDAELLEQRLMDLLLEVADRTTLEQQEIARELAQRDIEYDAGTHVLSGTFVCNACAAVYVHVKPAMLVECIECGGRSFQRRSS